MADKKLTDYLTIEFQIKLQKAISFATGFGVAFTNADGVHVGKLEQFCEFCSKINNTTEGVRLCECTNRNAINMAIETGQPAIYICHAGLVNIEIPIIYEDKCLGAITAGNVLCKDTEQFPRDEMDSSLFWKNNSELSAAYDQIPVVTKQQVIGMMETLTTMTNYIINEISYSQTQQALLRSEAIRLQLEQQLKVAQLDALQKQVAPHFLFNVLNTVSRLISLQEYEMANEMLKGFSQMMRYTLGTLGHKVALEQELKYINSYLSIQQIRFGKRVSFRVICDDELKKFEIPFFSLQPLVENAIEHGLLLKPDGGTMVLHFFQTPAEVIIEVKDDGVGIPADTLEYVHEMIRELDDWNELKHVGIYNCCQRFRLMFGRRVSFDINSIQDAGTRVDIRIVKNASS